MVPGGMRADRAQAVRIPEMAAPPCFTIFPEHGREEVCAAFRARLLRSDEHVVGPSRREAIAVQRTMR